MLLMTGAVAYVVAGYSPPAEDDTEWRVPPASHGPQATAGDVMADVTLAGIIDERRRFYNDTFTDIQFVVLQGGIAWYEDMEALDILLGQGPSSLDYEHPAELREDLMYVSRARVEMMLMEDMPSASLFRTDEPMGWREKICVITINPERVAGDDRAATYFLLSGFDEIRGRIRADRHLDRHAFLRFIFDHEAYHCLESNYIGPQPMSHLEHWAGYHDYRHENGADAFAVGMHIQRQGSKTAFVDAIGSIRGLSLFCEDCNHWTPDAIGRIADAGGLVDMDAMALVRYATDLRDEVVTDYNTYLVYLSSATQACRQLRGGFRFEVQDMSLPDPDERLVERMKRVFRQAYTDLTGAQYTVASAR